MSAIEPLLLGGRIECPGNQKENSANATYLLGIEPLDRDVKLLAKTRYFPINPRPPFSTQYSPTTSEWPQQVQFPPLWADRDSVSDTIPSRCDLRDA